MNEQFYIHAPWNVCPRMTFTVIDFYLSLIYDNNSSFIQLYIRVCIFVNVHLKVGCILRKTLACKTSIYLNNLVIQSLKHTYNYVYPVCETLSLKRSSAV